MTGDAAAWVAAGVAIVAALVSVWQATISRGQVREAKREADAAVEQVEFLRAERDERDGPKFEVDSGWLDELTRAKIRLVDGVDLDTVSASSPEPNVKSVWLQHNQVRVAGRLFDYRGSTIHNVRPGQELWVEVRFEDSAEHAQYRWVNVGLECTEARANPPRKWIRHVRILFERRGPAASMSLP